MAQDYDKIIKENLAHLLPALIRSVLRLPVRDMQKIPFDTQVTLERRPDYLLKIKLPGEEALLQLEFQSTPDPQMIERMLEYYSLQRRKHQLPIYQYVLYLGSRTPHIKTELIDKNIWFKYELIYLQNLDYELFLRGETPEEVILAILGNYMDTPVSEIIHSIFSKLKTLQKEGHRIEKYICQLEILADLRNLREEIINYTRTMAINYDLTKDPRFIEGIQQGVEQGIKQGVEQGIKKGEKQAVIAIVRNLVASPHFEKGLLTYQDIAIATQLPLKRVIEIHNQLKTS